MPISFWESSFTLLILCWGSAAAVASFLPDLDDYDGQRGDNSAGVASTVCCGHSGHTFACKEAVRYLYLSSGYLPSLVMLEHSDASLGDGLGDLGYRTIDDDILPRTSAIPDLCRKDAVVLMTKAHQYIQLLDHDTQSDIVSLKGEEHHTRLTQWMPFADNLVTSPGNVLVLIGGNHDGLKHGVYELVERYGIHFRIEGDIIPDQSQLTGNPNALLNMKVTGSPMFDIRGLQPFHDFPEGPDWWGTNHYKAIFEQMSKLRMNFLGLHTYPYASSPGTGRDEPTVWVGLKEDVNPDGSVKKSYPTSYANTMRNEWSDTALPTGQYHYGAKDIFPTDCYGSEVQVGNCPLPTTDQGNNEVFAKTGDMLKSAFQHAHALSVKTCVGTETPLSHPAPTHGIAALNLYYSKSRNDHFLTSTQCSECEGLYTFVSIQGYVQLTPGDGLIAVNTYFNGKLLDNVLSTTPIQGYTLVRTEGYVNASLWSYPGDTDDTMTTLQMYFNEKINDHLVAGTDDVKKYALANGYVLQSTVATVIANSSVKPPSTQDYYEGIFTRIMNLGLPLDYYWIWTPEGWEWGKMTQNNTVFQSAIQDLLSALAARDAVKAPFKLATCGWVVGPLPDRSIFDKVLPTDYDAITSIDMAVGNTPVDKAYLNITRHNKWAIPWMEDDPGLTAPELWVNRTLEHMEDAAKYGCNGLLGIHWRTKATSPQITAMAMKSWQPDLTSEAFWNTWCSQEFNNTAPAEIFNSIDSFALPRPVSWLGGPGGWTPNAKQCSVASQYKFVDELVALQSHMSGPGPVERFNYWVNSFLYMLGITATECAWAEYNAAASAASKIKDATERAEEAVAKVLPLRIQLVANTTQTMSYLLQTVISPGELGTIMNVLSHSIVKAIDQQTGALLAMVKPKMTSLPPNAMPQDKYTGPSRLIVPTGRAYLTKGENLTVTAMLLLTGSPEAPCNVSVFWRKVSDPQFTTVAMANVGRQVYMTDVNIQEPSSASPYLYYVGAQCPGVADQLVWPAGSPAQAMSLVVE